jgi:hypothetical protein
MLKHSLFGFLGLLASHTLTAQAPFSVYFEPNQHTLAPNSQASLDSLVGTFTGASGWNLEISAYTDDRGSHSANQLLAQQRAETVQAYLKKYGSKVSSIQLKPVGEIALAKQAKLPTEQARQQARRVEIKLLGETNLTTNPENIWSKLRTEHAKPQTFVCENPQQKMQILGSKGSKIAIPSHAFVIKNTQTAPKYPIQFALREAYTLGDMVLMGLSTSSDQQLIQTGGMIHLQANDADGKELELAADKSLVWELPSTDPLPEGMQVFTADYDHTQAHTRPNWKPQAQKFSSQPIAVTNNNNSFLTMEYITPYRKDPSAILKDKFLSTTIKTWEFNRRIPTKAYDYNISPLPKVVSLSLQQIKISDADLKKYPKRLFESNKKYKERIQLKIYLATQKTYDNNLKAFAKILTEEIFEKIQVRYCGAADFMLPADILANFDSTISRYQLDTFKQATDKLRAKYNAQIANLPAIQSATNFVNGFELANIYVKGRNHLFIKDLLERCAVNAKGKRIYQFSEDNISQWYNGYSGGYNLSPFCNRLDSVFNSPKFWESTQKTQLAYNELCKNFAQDFEKINAFIEEADDLRKAINNNPKTQAALQDLYDKQEKEREQMRNKIRNMVNLQNLGWVNCDRFADYPDLMQFSIPCEKADVASEFFLIIPSEKVILSLSKDLQRVFSPEGYAGLPASKNAVLIGIKNSSAGIEVCEHTSKISKLSSAKLQFKPVTETELKKILAKI